MAKIFLDNNIIIDFLVETRRFNKQAVELFLTFTESDTICYSYGSISDIYYVAKKCYDVEDKMMISFFKALLEADNFECLSLSKNGLISSFEYATQLNLQGNQIDIEDITQYFCAKENGCDVIYSNDKKFPQLDILIKRTSPEILDYVPNAAKN
ncbi:type II toxin-antitoxin system VapC family toxin [Campylobacter sp. RM16192]|uniref:type II toxin-antitoxin system VapC family toxin n=1 Tax=Campylobacter sp. RM16192 TaxID=1660080 RepID=UPI00159A93CE|nr:type II toxin-antitoxin system VapC family toxin [Campylobacter sp. RM16192]QKU36239.1 hypothetical protein CDOMC_a027 [Campylobacter sp. RM16192]